MSSKKLSSTSKKLSSRNISDTLLKTTPRKTNTYKTRKTNTYKTHKTHKLNKVKYNKRPHNIDKYCGFYKTDINGKINKKLYNSCKINKYCRKYKCQDIDSKMINIKKTKIGANYNKIIFDKILSSCPENLYSSDDDKKNKQKKQKCISKTIKQIYKDNNIEDLYKKSIECDKIICAKEQKIFNNNLFREKQLKLNKSQVKILIDQDLPNEVDIDLIKNGDL